MIPGSWNRAPHRALHWVWKLLGILSLSLSLSLPLCPFPTCVLSRKINKETFFKKPRILSNTCLNGFLSTMFRFLAWHSRLVFLCSNLAIPLPYLSLLFLVHQVLSLNKISEFIWKSPILHTISNKLSSPFSPAWRIRLNHFQDLFLFYFILFYFILFYFLKFF